MRHKGLPAIIIGFFLSLVAMGIGTLIPAGTTVLFVALFLLFWIAVYADYRPPFGNFLHVSLLLWLGHIIFLFTAPLIGKLVVALLLGHF